MKFSDQNYAVRRISPYGQHFFFGYYDIPAFDSTGTLHLAHKPSFIDRLQMAGDRVELGFFDLTNDAYHTIDTTEAWNFQQGAMLQWNPTAPDREVIYNAVLDGQYVGVVMDIKTGHKRYLDMPVANVSPDGRYALSVNFSRLYDFRPGYGYAHHKDPFSAENHSDKDGVFLIDMVTGKAKLIVSLQQLWDFTGSWFDGDRKLNINHITFNTDGSRFLMLVRNFRTDEKPHRTALVTANRDGSGLYLLSDYGVISHYHWKNREELLLFADCPAIPAYTGRWAENYVIRDLTHEGYLVDHDAFPGDNHMSYSPDRSCFLYDTYPDENRLQTLAVYDIAAKHSIPLGKFYSPVPSVIDIRCDLHPRWNRDGSMISFDSTHEGFRGIYLIESDR